MDSTSKCFLCGASAPNLSCPEPKCPVRACSQEHLALHLQPLVSQEPGLQTSPPQPSGQPASQTPASTSSPACLPYTITFKPGVGRCLVSWKEDVIFGRKNAGTLSSNSKCHRQYIKHIYRYWFLSRLLRGLFCQENLSFLRAQLLLDPIKWECVWQTIEVQCTHYPKFLYWPQRTEHEKQYQQRLKVNPHQPNQHAVWALYILPMIILCDNYLYLLSWYLVIILAERSTVLRLPSANRPELPLPSLQVPLLQVDSQH